MSESPRSPSGASVTEDCSQSDAGSDLQGSAAPQTSLQQPDKSSSSSDSEADDAELGTPSPDCVICLGRCKNKCFVDPCMHQFCFKCLCEWSKVKAECPLCKQAFKLIKHKVKSNHQFEEYHVQPPTVMDVAQRYRQEHRNVVRTRFPPNYVLRRYVYHHKLFALPILGTQHYRETSAQFFRDNPAEVRRLIPWINRDILYLLRNTEENVFLVVVMITRALTVHDIQSAGFRQGLENHLSTNTSQFIHELQNFARSQLDMIAYDRLVQYSDFNSSMEWHARAPSPCAERTNCTTSQSRLVMYTISRSSEGVESPGATATLIGSAVQSAVINLSTHNINNEMVTANMTVPSSCNGPSTSSVSSILTNDMQPESNLSAPVTSSVERPENIELFSDSSDECEFVQEWKPPHLVRPELISLSTETDSDNIIVDETLKLETTPISSSDDDTKAQPSIGSPEDPQMRSSVKNEEDFNVGASTSAGLVSTGRKRRQASIDADIEQLKKQQRHQ